MSIKEAINKLLKSADFQEAARKDARLRVFRQRWNNGEIHNGAAVNLLQDHGYTVDIKESKRTQK